MNALSRPIPRERLERFGKLLGIGIATREGDDDLARMSDGELAGELKRLAGETGLDVSVTARAGRPCSE